MELELNSEPKEGLDSVAQAIINIFSNDAETVEDHSLNIFLMKIYKNNLPSKPKRMNSIRLNRFNAFLCKVNSNFFSSNNANTILNQLIIGVLSNDKNFLEEEDEEIIMSIGKWISRIILQSTQKGFLEGVYELLRYLIEGQKPQILDINAFEQLLKKQSYYTSFQLDSQDEKLAYIEQSWFSLTSNLNIKAIILQDLAIKQIFSLLYSKSSQKKNVIKLFISYMTNLPNESLSPGIFSEIFFQNQLKSTEQLQSILQAYQSKCFTHDSLISSINVLVKRQENISHFFQIKFKNTNIEALFIQILTDHWKKKNIELLIDAFLSSKTFKNLIIIHLIIHSDQSVPKKYLDLLFVDGNLRFQQAVIISLALTHNHDRKIATQLINKYHSHLSLTNDRKSYLLRAIHYLFSQIDKKALFSNLLTEINFADVFNTTNFKFIPLSQINIDKVSAEQKTKLLKILNDFTDNSQITMKIKLDLWYLCNHWNQIGKRIRDLDQIIQRSPEQILSYLTLEHLSKDIEQYAALLMALNNKLKLYFITEPKEDVIRMLVTVYNKYYRNFGRDIASYNNIPKDSKLNAYYNCLFRYCLHTRKRVSGLTDVIGDLMNGQLNYKRVQGIEFADYLVSIPEKRGPLDQLWAEKKIAFQMKQLIDVVINFNGTTSTYKKQIRGMFDNEWINHLSFDVLRTYFDAEIRDQNVLREMLSVCQPSYDFFDKVQKFVTSENDNYIDILFYMPEILKEIYPDAITFLAALVDTQVSKKDVQKDKEKKKNTRKKKSEKVIQIDPSASDNIMDNNALFDIMIKRKQLKSLFGDSSQLKSFRPLIKIIGKINDQMNRLQRVVNQWLPTIKIFHCQRGDMFQSWVEKLQSYCELWNFFLAKKPFNINIEELQRHFHILTQFLNNIYEEKKSLPELQEKILLTLLLIHQASLPRQTQQKQIPTQDLKNFFLGYHLPTTSEHHFYHCFTCNLPICQICMPFLHKNHDINYLGKDGYCVHDTNQKRKSDRQEQRPLRQERVPRQMQRYAGINNANIFQAPPYTSLMRAQRRQEELFFPNFDIPDDQMQFGEHLRFKQIMQMRVRQQRQREKQREKQKQLYISRQKEKILREKEQFLSLIERQKLQDEGQESQIRSSSSKSIKNIAIGQFRKACFMPQFNPFPDKIKNYRKTIDTKPLRCILQRQLHSHSNGQSGNLQKVKIQVLTTIEKYTFFNKSNYFKYNNRPQYGIMRGMTAGMANGIRKNLLSSNNKFLAYPNTNNGIVLLSIPNMINKMTRRIQLKTYVEMEQERGFLTGSINNSNFSFEPTQVIFNKLNPNLLAIVGVVQLGFAVISNEGKFMKYCDTDFKSSEPISKFIWLSKHKNLFAVSTGNSIRIGHINDEGRAKTVNKFKIQIQKPIRDFQANLEGGSIYLYIIDSEGDFYRTQFDYKGLRVLNVNDKKVTYPQNIQKIQSLIFADKKIILSSENGKIYLLRVEAKIYPPSFQQAFDIEAALKSHQSTKFIKPPYYLSQPSIIQTNQSFFSIIGIIKRLGVDPKKRGGILVVIRVNSKNSLQFFLLHEQDNIEGYQSVEISENNYLITAVDENGNMLCFNYNIPLELYTSKEAVNNVVNDSTVKACNGLIKDMHILELTKYCDPKKYDNFKETKDISFHYKTTIGLSESIRLVTNEPFKYFWTGLIIMVQPKDNNSEGFFQYELFGQLYTFKVPKAREIQIPFNIKETLRIFTEDGQFVLQTRTNLELKSIKVHGLQYNIDSIYKKIYVNLNRLVMTNLAYNPNSLEDYLQNVDRNDISAIDLAKFADLKQTHKYDVKQLNLLMKLQLLRQSIDQNSINIAGQLEDHLDSIKTNIMPQCQKRNYLEKSCRKLVRRICQLAIPETQGIIGHPFEYRTFLDIYYFEESYLQWANTRHINHFEHLTNLLFSLIFKRIGNLYIIFKTYPDLVHEMTFFFKTLLNCIKVSKNEIRDQAKLQKLITICPNFVAILCEYYQTLKNSSANTMVDESQQNTDKDQSRILSLFEEIFCATRKQLYRQIFISPDVYLQRLYCTPKLSHPILTAISIFQIKDRRQQSFQEIKSSHISNSDEVKEQEYIQLDDESEKQLMGQQQAREMGDFISEQNDDKGNQMSEQESKISNPRKFKKTYEILNNYKLPQGGFLNFTYYQFSFNMATALFNLEDYLKEQNVVFYVGFFFNILRIIEMNFEKKRDQDYLNNLFEAIYKRIYSKKHSPLFMVLNYFFEPNYGAKILDSRVVEPSKCRLCLEFVQFLNEKQVSIEDVFINFSLQKTAPTISLGEAMKFTPFQIENNLYQLKFLGNLYFNVKLRQNSNKTPNNQFKYKILGGIVRYKLRVLKNIMYFEGWQQDLEEAKVEVGFESLTDNQESGLNMLYDCSKNNPSVFIKKLTDSSNKIEVLESTLLTTSEGKLSGKILEMLTTYYSN